MNPEKNFPSQDISKILDEWPFDPDFVSVRIIDGDQGGPYIQMRADLGLFQMHFAGRPDGIRPEGAESWLEYYEDLSRAHEGADPFKLDEESCDRLWNEAVQYYHRYLSFWYLKLFDLCARDTCRNLRLYDFVRVYAHDESTKSKFDNWRPYALMMYVRARTVPLIERGRISEAVPIYDEGIEGIYQFLEWYGLPEETETCPELIDLKERRQSLLEKTLEERIATDPVKIRELRLSLDQAIRSEDYEKAAKLRDAIRENEVDDRAPMKRL
jgi:UvrB/uvrC motif